MKNNLEELIEKSEKVRDKVSVILQKEFPVEKEYADFLAMDVVQNAIGTDMLEKYNSDKTLKQKKAEEERLEAEKMRKKAEFKRWVTQDVIPNTVIGGIILMVVSGVLFGIYSLITMDRYPRIYKPLPEVVRFEPVSRNSWNGDDKEGLNDNFNLCVANYSTTGYSSRVDGTSETCIHRNKYEKLNQAMQNAVDTDFNGVVWNEPNGNGEVWKVERNNYRFVITATRDESFVEP